MKPKRISIRFNMENENDRTAWEYLQVADNSKNSTVISAINAYFKPNNMLIADIVRQTIQDCFRNVAIMQAPSDDETALLDSLDDFLGG